jgi:peptidoglycan/xylan/chitin deacetylase (PgdA/CDA1 family)
MALSVPLIRAGLARDPLESATYSMIEFERRENIRSTLYAMPFANRTGRTPAGTPAPANRACFYDVAAYTQWFRELAGQGWELGVHGIDSHLDRQAAYAEKRAIEQVIGREVAGLRMHWLYHKGDVTHRLLQEVGYLYDATIGWNDAVGWPNGSYVPYRASNGLWILPLNIQDVALLGDGWNGPRPAAARQRVKQLLAEARSHRAVVTLLWHNNNFAPPNCWSEFYRWIIEQARADRARIMTAREVVEQYQAGAAQAP